MNFKIPNAHLYCEQILGNVSRSFAIGINTLKADLRRSVLVAYLLCRIADTIEDDFKLLSMKKILYLNDFLLCFEDSDKIESFASCSKQLHGDLYHIDLVKNSSYVFSLFYTLADTRQMILKKWITEMVKGMIKFIKKYPLGIRIKSLNEYKEYCYYVAGTVGYLLTDLWHECGYFINNSTYQKLYKNAASFGEALQTINILKDIRYDLQQENAIFIPSSNMNDNKIYEIIDLAQENLNTAVHYIENIPKINISIRLFCIFPLLLAFATLREIKNVKSIFTHEKKIKVTRKETKNIYINSYLASYSNFWLRYIAKYYAKQ